MDNQLFQIANYIKSALESGIPLEQIKVNVKEQGWNDSDFEAAYKIANIQPPVTQSASNNISPQQILSAKPSTSLGLKIFYTLIIIVVMLAISYIAYLYFIKK